MTLEIEGKRPARLFPRVLALAAATVIASVAALFAQSGGSEAQSAAMIGIDVIPGTNQPSSLGELETCASAEVGDVFAVDVFINNVTDLTKWEARVEYDSDVLALEEADYNQFLVSAAPGGSAFPTLFDLESSGRYFLAAAEVQAAPDSGSGTLARLTMRAVDEGRSAVRVVNAPTFLGPQLSGVNGAPLGDSTGDSIWDGAYLAGEIVVGDDCDGDSPVVTPKPDPGPGPRPSQTAAPGNGGSGGNGSSGNGNNGGSGGASGSDIGGNDSATSGEQVLLIDENGELIIDGEAVVSSEDEEAGAEDNRADGSITDGDSGGDTETGDTGSEAETGTGVDDDGSRDGNRASASGSGSDGADSTWVIVGFGAAAALLVVGGGLYAFARRRL